MASTYKYLIGIFFVPFFQKFINYQMSWKIKLLDPQKWWTHRLVPMSHAKNILLLFLHNAPISAGSGISDPGFGFLNCHGELGFRFFIFCQLFLSYICKITNIGDSNKNLSKMKQIGFSRTRILAITEKKPFSTCSESHFSRAL